MTLARDELLEREHAGWESLTTGRGGAFYGDLMTEDAVMVLVNGMCLDKPAVVASLDQAPPWDSFELTNARVVDLGPDAAALVYTARAERAGSEPFEALMTSVYRRVGGSLRLALYQQTTATH